MVMVIVQWEKRVAGAGHPGEVRLWRIPGHGVNSHVNIHDPATVFNPPFRRLNSLNCSVELLGFCTLPIQSVNSLGFL